MKKSESRVDRMYAERGEDEERAVVVRFCKDACKKALREAMCDGYGEE